MFQTCLTDHMQEIIGSLSLEFNLLSHSIHDWRQHHHISTELLVTGKHIASRRESILGTESVSRMDQLSALLSNLPSRSSRALAELKLLKCYLKSLYVPSQSTVRKAFLFLI